DLGSYQHAVRLVLTNDLITEERPRVGALAAVLRWADSIARDVADLLGYTLVATTRQVRLVRRLDSVDPSQRTIFVTRSGRPFDRRRLAYLCLVLAVFQRSRIEISLADLVRALAPTANAIAGLGFDATSPSTSARSWTPSTGCAITARCACPTARPRSGLTTPSAATRSTTSITTCARCCSARRSRSSSSAARPTCWRRRRPARGPRSSAKRPLAGPDAC